MLTYFLVKKNDCILLLRKQDSLTKTELQRIERGLCRAIFFEALLVVPASATLLAGLAVVVFPIYFASQTTAYFFVFGFVSVGFPLHAVKKLIVSMALKALEQTVEEYEE